MPSSQKFIDNHPPPPPPPPLKNILLLLLETSLEYLSIWSLVWNTKPFYTMFKVCKIPKLSELWVTHGPGFFFCYPGVKNYFRSATKIFHSNVLRMLELRVEIPWDFRPYQASWLNCSLGHGLGIEAHNTTKLRHRLRDIVVTYWVTAEIWSSWSWALAKLL